MKNSSFLFSVIIVICFVLACLTGAASVLVVVLTAAGIGGELSFHYFEFLKLPILSIAMPVVGMLSLGASLLMLFRRRQPMAATAITEKAAQSAAPDVKSAEVYLKAA